MTPRIDSRDDSAVDNVLGQQVMGDFRPADLVGTAATLARRGLRAPAAFASQSLHLAADLGDAVLGQGTREPTRGDRRFTDPAWAHNPFFTRLLQGYLALVDSLDGYAGQLSGGTREAERNRFLMTQVGNALAPTNFLLTNPEALRAAVESRGVTVARGGLNVVDDLRHRRRLPSTVDESQFEVGGNLAVTPGSVVWRTEMFELIQYAPQTDEVYAIPVLIVPSIVNKFYVFDLAPDRSVIEYLVQQGFTVFVLAWRNPGKRHDGWGMAAYQNAILHGIDVARQISRADRVNLWAVCGAGPVAVSVAAYLEAIGEQKVNSLLLVVSPLDTAAMSEAPGIGAFVDKDEPAAPEPVARAARGRRLSAGDFALLFAMLRSNEMIWNAWVSGYLLGKRPPAFDVLYWNADGTGMTAQFNHDFSLFVEENPFLTPGAMVVHDTPIAPLGSLSFDSYVLGAKTDHLCIWQGVYRSAALLGPESLFVLGNSGHIQTIVCPPGNPRASFRTGTASHDTPAEWLTASEEHQGSWWPHYVEWLTKRSLELIPAPQDAGDDDHPVIAAAPGLYVHERV